MVATQIIPCITASQIFKVGVLCALDRTGCNKVVSRCFCHVVTYVQVHVQVFQAMNLIVQLDVA